MGTYDLGGVAGGKGKDTSVNIALNPEEIDLDDDTLMTTPSLPGTISIFIYLSIYLHLSISIYVYIYL